MQNKSVKQIMSAGLAVILSFSGVSAFAQAENSFTAGHADRNAWETWIVAQAGDFLEGAFYWSGQRSLPNPGPCTNLAKTKDWRDGCVAAQGRLALSDVRRKSDPDYKRGWNSPVDIAAPAAAAAPTPPRSQPTSLAPTPTQQLAEAAPMQIVAPLPRAPADAAPMSVEDYLLDKQKLGYSIVTVKGEIACMGPDSCELYGENSSASTRIDFDQLPREDRKKLLSCDIAGNRCPATVRARGGLRSYDPLQAISIAWALSPAEVAASDKSLPTCTTVDKSDLIEMAESSPMGKITGMKVISLDIIPFTTASGLITCQANMTTSAGVKKLNYYYTKQGSTLSITGAWVLN